MSNRSSVPTLAVLVVTALFLAAAGCDGGPTEIQSGGIRVSNATRGGDPDRDGYRVTIDSLDPESLAVGNAVVKNDLPAGTHTVELRDVAANCRVLDDNPRLVVIPRGGIAEVSFVVECKATGIQVNILTSGLDPDVDGYFVAVDSAAAIAAVSFGGVVTVTYLSPGAHTISLSGVAANCAVTPASPLSVTVTASVLTPVNVGVACLATTGVLEITAATGGLDLDSNGIGVQVDQGASLALGSNAVIDIPGLAPGGHDVSISGLSANCTLGGSNPRAVTITAGGTQRDTTRITIASTCTPVTGVLLVDASVAGLDPDGSFTLRLDGGPAMLLAPVVPFLVQGLSGGSHTVQLGDLANNCSATANPRTVTIAVGGTKRDTVRVSFAVACIATTGVLQVTVATTGADLDLGGYTVRMLDIGRIQPVSVNGVLTDTLVPVGDHFVGLGDVDANCAVGVPNPRSVLMAAGVTARDTVRIAFAVSCTAVTGAIRVSNTTSGTDLDPNGYSVHVLGLDYSATLDLPTNGAAVLTRVPPGSYLIGAPDGASLNCAAASGTGFVTVAVGDTAPATFDVACAPAARLAVAIDLGSGRLDIHSVKSNGAGRLRLTTDPVRATEPAWSFDGTRIAFVSARNGIEEIYAMDADGTGQVRLAAAQQSDRHPSWSPGGKIAFASRRAGNTDIWVMDADGSNQVRLTSSPGEDITPAWSPDGTRIAFASNRDGNFELYVMNADGSNQARITRNSVDDIEPDWSPGSAQIVVSRLIRCDYYYGCDYDLVVMNADGSAEKQLPLNTNDGAPSWSPDGLWIAFGSSYCDYYYGCVNYGIMAIRPDGTGLIQIIADGYEPAWHR